MAPKCELEECYAPAYKRRCCWYPFRPIIAKISGMIHMMCSRWSLVLVGWLGKYKWLVLLI